MSFPVETKVCSKSLWTLYFFKLFSAPIYAILKSYTLLERSFLAEYFNWLIFFWKLKNGKKGKEKNEDFFGWAKNIEFILFRIFELRWFQICAQIFHIFLGSKVTALQRGVKTAKKGQSGPTLKGCSLCSKKDMKNLSTDLESAKFKYFKKYQFDIFGPSFFNFQKISIN